jgi:hypothetical protein
MQEIYILWRITNFRKGVMCMSIITCVYVPEGIVMSADSRLTVSKDYGNGRAEICILSDNSQKLFKLTKAPIGISSCGEIILNQKMISDFLRLFEIEKVNEGDNVEQIARKLNEYAQSFLAANRVEFLIAGYFEDKPYVYHLCNGQIVQKNNNNGKLFYGASWRGETLATYKLFSGEPQTRLCFDLMPLRDAIDFSEFIVELTIKYQRFEDNSATCGGPIDTLVITKDKVSFTKHKIYNS